MNIKKALEFLTTLKNSKNHNIIVAGDLMLDEFHWCHVSRISPEAPVPICKIERTELLPGGAANVAHNIKTLGFKPFLLGVIGADSSGKKLIEQLHKAKVSADYILKDPERPTTLKTRVIAHHQQVVRVDKEDTTELSEAIQSQFSYKLKLLTTPIHGIVISDYLKGTITNAMLSELIKFGQSHSIPIVVDPKGTEYKKYTGATVLTPNFGEFQQAIHQTIHSEEELETEARKMIKDLHLEGLIITRSEKGISIFTKKDRMDIPTKAREVYDITGAGDTVISVLTLGLASGLSLSDAALLANEAAGIVVGKLGTATVTLDELKHALEHHEE